MAEALAVRLSQDVIIPSCGLKRAGVVVSKEEAGESFGWLLENGMAVPAKPGEPSLPVADDEDPEDDEESDEDDLDSEEGAELPASTKETTVDATPEEPVVLTEEDTAVIAAVKELLTQGKMQLKTIVSQSGLSEEVVIPLLTEANGFRKNQQGWYSNV